MLTPTHSPGRNTVDKPFSKTPHNIITCTIDENGDVIYLATDSNDAFLNDGTEITRRASHVEPVQKFARICFYILRWFGDKGRIAEWTRNWNVLWRVNTKPVGGPILTWDHVGWNSSDRPLGYATWTNRQDAIDFEIAFLNDWFLERGIQ
jgi:hypothetical protein